MDSLQKRTILTYETIGMVFIILLGSLFHFTFELSDFNPVVGAFSAVNESVWEHLKLGFWPFGNLHCYWILENKRQNKQLFSSKNHCRLHNNCNHSSNFLQLHPHYWWCNPCNRHRKFYCCCINRTVSKLQTFNLQATIQNSRANFISYLNSFSNPVYPFHFLSSTYFAISRRSYWRIRNFSSYTLTSCG